MASSAGDGALRPLQRAMKLANKAIQLDTGNQHQEAYVEYLKCVSYISQFLLEEAELKAGNEMLTSDPQKLLKLAEQCLERAWTTAGKLGRTDTDQPSVTTCISNVPDPPPSEASSTAPVTSSTVRSPLGRSWGHRRACSDEAQNLSPFPPPEMFQMLLAAEAQSSRKELTPLEEASLQNQKLKATYEVRLSRLNPSQAAQKTSLTLSLQRQMMENLVIAKAREETLQRKAEERRLRLQEESNRRFSRNSKMTPEEEEQRTLYTAVLEYEQDHEWSKACKINIKSNPGDTNLVSSFMYQILSTADHPISKLLRRLQYQIYSRLYPAITKDPSHTGNFSKLCRRSLPVDGLPVLATSSQPLKSSQSLHCLPCSLRPSMQHSLSAVEGPDGWGLSEEKQGKKGRGDNDMENSFEDLESLLSPTEDIKATQILTGPQLLKATVKEIHNAQDALLSASILSLDLPDTPSIRDVCLECLEDSFFPPLWPALLALYRQVFYTREESLLQTMDSYTAAHPSVLGVPQKLFPQNVNEPYKAAVEVLEHLSALRSPQRKLDCIVRTLRVICECAEEYSPTSGTSAIGADYLLPILVYVVLRSRMSRLLSECAALEEFIHEGYLVGEEGYCLTSLQSAVSYLETLPRPLTPSTA
ncbi:VPS9 domain-containing protein 1 [Spea bombifrons]|uniref:VPS9 domain-containing protein 1 n=1 Tax=Spea bombifrons TaxID=233779 RepID=UPI00234BF8CA|nr:VPS9 domain-containing protein 1 [Spea bombifrons]